MEFFLWVGCRERAVRETLRKSQAEAEAAASELERSQEVLLDSACHLQAALAPLHHDALLMGACQICILSSMQIISWTGLG